MMRGATPHTKFFHRYPTIPENDHDDYFRHVVVDAVNPDEAEEQDREGKESG
jgi:hypothetical protein